MGVGFLEVLFWYQLIWLHNFWWHSIYIVFNIGVCAFGAISKTPLLNPSSRRFMLMLFSKSFYSFLGLTFRCLVHFKYCVCACVYCLYVYFVCVGIFIFLHVDIQLSQHHFFNRLFFVPWIFCNICWNQLTILLKVDFWTSSCILMISMSMLWQYHPALNSIKFCNQDVWVFYICPFI